MKNPLHVTTLQQTAQKLGLHTQTLTDTEKTRIHIQSPASATAGPRSCIIDGSTFYPSSPKWFYTVAGDKITSDILLQKHNIPCVKSYTFAHTHYPNPEALKHDILAFKHFPILFKPAVGLKGRGIQIVANAHDLTELAVHHWNIGSSFLLQPIYQQTEYRILIVNNTVYAAHAKQLLVITGDGTRTIDSLLHTTAYPTDSVFIDLQLTKHGYSKTTILPKGETIPYSITRKGDPALFFGPDEIPPAMQAWAQSIVAKLGVATIGIDVFVPDDYTNTSAYRIIEINSNPGFTYLATKYQQSDLVTQIARDILMQYFAISPT